MNVPWVKCQLRAYLCRELIRDDLLDQLLYIDEDITISTMNLTGMPRSKSLPSSTVENQVLGRERICEMVNAKIAAFDKSCERMATALMSLGDDEYTVVTHLYFSVDYEDDDLAQEMGISAADVREIRKRALHKLYHSITSCSAEQTLQNRTA